MAKNIIDTHLALISATRLENEDSSVARLKEEMDKISYSHKASAEIARAYIRNFRAYNGNLGLEEFFRQYGLNTDEGLAVMSLAEALLRIPDAETANAFIRDKLSSAKWSSKNSKSTSSLVKASSLGLKLASKLTEMGKTVTSMADPVIRQSMKQSMRLMGNHFIMGETTKSAIKKGQEYEQEGYTISYDMLGEGARDEEQAEKYLKNYLDGLREVAASSKESQSFYDRPSISVKLSALYSKYKLTNKDQVFEKLLPRLKEIILKAKELGVCVTIDAEESSRLDLSLELFAAITSDKDFKGFNGIGIAVQAYNKSAIHVIDFIIELAKTNKRHIPVRLVKGAYWDSEIKAAQIAGTSSFPVFTRKEYTDVSYLICAHKMLKNLDVIYPQFATHNALTIASIRMMAENKRNFEFQRLYGMGEGIYGQMEGVACRIYAPVGTHKELLPYLIRRILENGASTSFLKKVVDEEVNIEELIKDPALALPAKPGLIAKGAALPQGLSLPPNLYGDDRKNSSGFDLGNASHLKEIKAGLENFKNTEWNAAPIINGRECKHTTSAVFAPYDIKLKIGSVTTSSPDDIKSAIDITAKAFKEWSATHVNARAKIIEKFANLLEENCFEIMSLCIKEAGKTIPDSIAELREAVDFCRYYAARARELFANPKIMKGPTGELNELSLHGRGMFMCISPWNFPLAIFTGQVVAALVSGNTVIAKPAEQTPLIAAYAVKLLLKAGLPYGVVSLLPGDGASIGSQVLGNPKTAGVVFTGSTDTAHIIQQTLAKRKDAIVPFIAETGGLNAMIIDSSALIEQAVDDIITSAFGSTGQRCSALRVLYVQEEIAGELIKTLKGAMENLLIGMPGDFKTDIGPVIDAEAYKNLSDYIKDNLKSRILESKQTQPLGSLILDSSVLDSFSDSFFIPPIAFEINSIKDLPGEIFGPVLHIIRYKADGLEKIIEEINESGYGLTFGIHSRITSRIKYIRANIRVGNVYVNRSMIGAVVGVQAFGGEGLSGTGPKAGGPNYLLRFATERSFTDNISAIGGNRDLLVL